MTSSSVELKSNDAKAEALEVESVPNGRMTLRDELNDHPKNWKTPLKLCVYFNICLMAFLGNSYGAGITSGFGLLVKDLHTSYSELSAIIAYVLLVIGLGAFIWIPTAVVIGKRPVLVVSQLVFIVACVWDIFFEKDYAKAMSFYSLCLCLGSQLGPLIGGHIMQNKGWRWFFILMAILASFNFVTLVTACPETAFELYIADGSTGADVDADILRHSEAGGPRQSTITTMRRNIIYFKHPHVRGGGIKQWVLSFLLQVEFLFDPIVLFASGLWGICIAWVAGISVINPQIFAMPPYLWGPAGIGNFAAASLIGGIIAIPFAGPLTDTVSRLIDKKRGKHMPEHRLISLIFPFLIAPPGLLIFGYTYPKGSYIAAAVGYAMELASLTLVPGAVLSYAVDSYPYDSAEAASLINAVTHVISYALSLTASDWLHDVGVSKMFLQMAITQWAILAGIGGVLFVLGPRLRTKATHLHKTYGIKRLIHTGRGL
ncbi:related to HOL1 protein [Cephalotrichum gorgonifer]|uniref:Related to HOL1 protein n=1 Tax=Cephalotrichum gorgonifer TaxID=2041049 RepID=A0AAE8SWE2_9PEZI|nr:related to HOL1 protein [Cephalotrichum gorgonifer]